jgi:hypothetical protein
MNRTLLAAAVAALMLALTPHYPCAQEGPLGGGLLGGGIRNRLEHMREHMTDKNPNIRYNPAVLTPGTPRSQVEGAFGKPNGTQNVGGVQEDVYAFFPDGSKYVDPQITAGTIAAAVFTGGMSLAVKAAKNTIQQNQLTLYDVRYDANQNVQSVKVIPPNVGSEPKAAASPQAAGGNQPMPNANW